MDSRERTLTALKHEEPDRVPLDFWGSAALFNAIKNETGMDKNAFLEWADVDFRYIDGPLYTGPPLPPDTDIWGVRRHEVVVEAAHGTERYAEGDTAPLAKASSAGEIEEYALWPNPDHFDYGVVKPQCLAVQDEGRVVVFMGDRLNRVAQLKPAMYLRGIDNIFMDLALNRDMALTLFRRIRSFYAAYLERILDAAGGLIDIVLTGDDFGQQNGLLISKEMWEEFLSEGFRRYIEIVHAHGALAMHHTCGDVRALAGRMHELGLDVLQSLQPEAMGDALAQLKAEYGGTLSFQGGISVQKTMPWGSPEDVEKEVRERIAALAPGGGYILCTAHNIQADCPVSNVLALVEAHRKHGSYK